MKKALPFLMIILFLILTNACQNDAKNEKKTDHSSKDTKPASGGIVAGSIVPSIDWKEQKGKINVTFHLKNQTERVAHFHFNSSKRWDYLITSADGKKIYQLSDNKIYAYHTGTLTLKQGEEVSFNDETQMLPAGEYQVKVWLTSNEKGPQIEQKVTVKGKAQ